jgi:hypothetical protein
MRSDAENLEKLVAEGVITNVSRAHRDLGTRVRRFIKESEVITDGKKYNINISRTGRREQSTLATSTGEGSCPPGRSSCPRKEPVEALERGIRASSG